MDSEAEGDGAVVAESLADPAAFAVIFERHHDAIYRYLARRIGSQAAEDLAAECFVVAFQVRKTFDVTRPSARPWLFGIATNLLRNDRRRETNRLVTLSRVGQESARSTTTLPDDVTLDRDALRRTATALAKLRPEHRDALVLVAVVGLSYEETAEALGIPMGTVRSRVSTARDRLARNWPLAERAGEGERHD